MKRLKASFKNGDFQRAYLLYGEEKYLIRHYENQFKEKLLTPDSEMMNFEIFEGKNAPIDSIIDAARTMPFFHERRLIFVRDSRLFAAGRKEDSEKMSAFLPVIPDTTVLVFVEDEVDRRGRLYKKMAELGHAAELQPPAEKELYDWVGNMFKKRGKNISKETIQFLLRTVGRGMEELAGEIEKLTAYQGESAPEFKAKTKSEITAEDVAAVCPPALETRIFDLIDAVGHKKPEIALDIFSNMLIMKEQPLMVLTMIARQFRLMLQSKVLREKGHSTGDIAALLSMRSFVVSECLRQSQNFSQEEMLAALEDCLSADLGIKMGRLGDRIALETLIVKYAAAI
ncbi:MAG: DNA polymerase III subunit delta [Clostridiales bacterium]|jgi:DNA polymerase-3 subunit delta|nr:DNA polymerase III subunit delta [Clostridiales bacterium]